jgi:mRNA interferase RelE/StbE
MKFRFSKNADKDFRKLLKSLQKRIALRIDFFSSQKNPFSFAEHLTNFNLGKYRFRIGDYRLTFDVENDVIYILKIQHRRDIYKKK